MDLGTGDGRAVLARAAAEPRSLVLGVDAAAAGMAESSRRADRARPRLSNAMFIVAGAAALPQSPLAARADLLTVTMPWASLLRGVLGEDRAALVGVAAVLALGGRLEVLVSVTPRDGLPMAALSAADEPRIRAAWASAGLSMHAFRPATRTEIAASGSTWARRLLRGGSTDDARPVWLLAGTRDTGLTG